MNIKIFYLITIVSIITASTATARLQYETRGNEIHITGYTEEAETSTLTIPATIDGKSVLSISPGAFTSISGLTEITLPDSITSIGKGAFAYCTTLDSINLPSSLTSLPEEAFIGCIRLRTITIGNSVTSIGDAAFFASGLTSIDIPNSVTTIGKEAFAYCLDLSIVNMGSGLVDLPEAIFAHCVDLTDIQMSPQITEISERAFFNCDSLVALPLSNSIVNIGDEAFAYCDSASFNSPDPAVAGITFPENLQKIGKRSFAYCNGLREISFGVSPSITSIGEKAFLQCKELRNFTIPSTVTSIGNGAFAAAKWLKIYVDSGNTHFTVVSRKGLYNADSSKLIHCLQYSGTEFVVPSTVTEIAPHAFWSRTNLSEIDIGAGLTTIGDYAFRMNKNLEKISFGGSAPANVSPFVFSTYYAGLKLRVLPNFLGTFGGIYIKWNNGIVIARIDDYIEKYKNGSLTEEDSEFDADPHSLGVKNAVAHVFGIPQTSRELTASERRRLPQMVRQSGSDLKFEFVLPDLIPEDSEIRVLYSNNLSTPGWSTLATKKANYDWTGSATVTESPSGQNHTSFSISAPNVHSEPTGFMSMQVIIN